MLRFAGVTLPLLRGSLTRSVSHYWDNYRFLGFKSEPVRAVAQDRRFCGGTRRIHEMRSRRGNPPRQVKEYCGRVFVGGDWSPESHVAEMLQRVGQRVVCGIGGAPQSVAFGELLRREGGETQKIIRSVFDHIDGEIVAREDLKLRAILLAQF